MANVSVSLASLAGKYGVMAWLALRQPEMALSYCIGYCNMKAS
jgi:hypothetical protein